MSKHVSLTSCTLIIVALLVASLIVRWVSQSTARTFPAAAGVALQWWESRQFARLHQEAETIRNGLLQELFVMRRHLELLQNDKSEWNTSLNGLIGAEQLHNRLQKLSDDLSPPYLDDSLPLAIQSALDAWQIQHPTLPVELNLPPDWWHESQERNHIILMGLSELLRLMVVEPVDMNTRQKPTHATIITLKQSGAWGTLSIQTTYPDAATLAVAIHSIELQYLNQAFCVLTDGQCFQRQQAQTVNWQLRWQSSTPKRSDHHSLKLRGTAHGSI